MDFYQAIAARRTVRHFSSSPVETEKINRVLTAGLSAPSNAHLKSWQFILLKDRGNRRAALADAMKARDLKNQDEIEKIVDGKSEELKEVYRRALPFQLTMMLTAPEVLLACYRMKALGEIKTHFELNPLASVWLCIENILLAMSAEGLYGCTYTPFETRELKAFLGLPPGYEVGAVIPFGYPAVVPEPNKPEPLPPRLHIDRW